MLQGCLLNRLQGLLAILEVVLLCGLLAKGWLPLLLNCRPLNLSRLLKLVLHPLVLVVLLRLILLLRLVMRLLRLL